MSATAFTYVAYLVLAFGVTIQVGRSLHRNGRALLLLLCHGRENLADTVNHVLVAGLYLVVFGYALAILPVVEPLDTAEAVIETLAGKLAPILVLLGSMHFLALYITHRVRPRERRPLRRSGGLPYPKPMEPR